MYRFLVVIEKANNNYSAYSPDLPGCVATQEPPVKKLKITCMRLLKCISRDY